MKVMSINCQNNKTNRNGGADISGYDYTSMLSNHILDYEYDIVGTQEMSPKYTEKLEQKLDNYKLSGSYRNDFKILKKIFPKVQELRENDKIILKGKIINEKTIKLPWIPYNPFELFKSIKRKSLMRRIASGVLLETEELGKVYILNTHLDYAIKSVQKRQLRRIYHHLAIKQINYPIIITGDFNLEVGNEIFDKFIGQLSKINIKRVPINDKTNALKYNNKSAIDHIFISNYFDIIDYGIVSDDNLFEITDHKAIFVEFSKGGINK